MKLSDRLRRIAEQVPAGSVVADIGTDHGLLPVALVSEGTAERAVAADVNRGPLEAARRQVAMAGLGDRIDLRLGNGLSVLREGEVDVVVIAGMGGSLIADILEAGRDRLPGVKRLVLQPNVAADQVRRWLLAREWKLIGEQILEEDEKIYEILTAEPAAGPEDASEPYEPLRLCADLTVGRELQLLMGPHLLRRPEPVFAAKWRYELEKLEMIRRQLANSGQEAARERERELGEQARLIGEVLACLPKGLTSSN
ncbi:tRNA (adenine(22)-N(1))-methyltransferase [Paenibacillus thermoaerophilus]|uniref:tRNA (Adenine(22)-N(1))-methyltransferase n=1 Tax=Paenibacillus thermoaerophilus TaxID=1215385 RepID=A0ABW2UXK0_9BACL|nr:tRNA (adenine(22)-N(1))-methyltransferase TrmK [Paenibacillus thermoaerophilus]TMV19040.1 tRNA (adenine-N(1))-methyltransferase [Paenibacillus thermoaerophilus]